MIYNLFGGEIKEKGERKKGRKGERKKGRKKMAKCVLLNARGTIIRAPIELVEKSKVVKVWWDALSEEGKNVESFPLDYEVGEVEDMLVRNFGRNRLEDYLMMGLDGRQYEIVDVCNLWLTPCYYSEFGKKIWRDGFKMTFVLESFDVAFHMFFIVDDGLYMRDCDNVLSIQRYVNEMEHDFKSFSMDDLKFKRVWGKTGKYEGEGEDGEKYYLLPHMNECLFSKRMGASRDDESDNNPSLFVEPNELMESMMVCAKRKGIELGEYMESMKLLVINKSLKKSDPRYGGTFSFRNENFREIIAEIMYIFFADICGNFDLRPRLMRKLVEIVGVTKMGEMRDTKMGEMD